MSKETPLSKFNVRVYALIIENGKVLVSDEIIKGLQYTKFPGGGLELGESSIDCLQREALEEMGQDLEVLEHYYTTDQFVRSYFRPWEQVLSIYFKARFTDPPRFRIAEQKFDFDSSIVGDQESFRWADIQSLDPSDFQFLIDSHVVKLLRNEYGYF